jgi:NAD(P)-dependent dehydrogenase (short-subunit alcohol dehydrogenase family)
MGALNGKVALVTGGARGQGRSHALALAREGADIALADIADDISTVPYHLATKADLAATVAQVEALDRRVISFVADIRSTEQVNRVVESTISEFGRIDVLAANAGIISYSSVDETTDEMWANTLETNLTGIFKVTRAVLPHMRGQGWGRVVATASSIARSGRANVAAYAASKWGVIGFVKSCAQDVAGTGITVNALAPSSVETDMIYNPATFKLFCPDLDNPTAADFEARVRDIFGPGHFPAEEVSRALMYFVLDERGVYQGNTMDIEYGMLTRNAV